MIPSTQKTAFSKSDFSEKNLTLHGRIITRSWYESPTQGTCIELWIKTDDGPIRAIFTQQENVFFVAAKHTAAVEVIIKGELKSSRYRFKFTKLKDFNESPITAFYFRHQYDFFKIRAKLREKGLRALEDDIQLPDRFLMERFITSGITLSGSYSKGFFPVFTNPSIKPHDTRVNLKFVSIDIETSMCGRYLYSIGVIFGDSEKTELSSKHILMVNKDQGEKNQLPYLTYYINEESLLNAFIELIVNNDPDAILGWNVVNFDLRFLAKKFKQHKLAFAIGRKNEIVDWRTSRDNPEHYLIFIPGRIVLDGIEILKTATYHLSSFSLNRVAKELLGEEKEITSKDRGAEITRQYREDKEALARYNLKDCQLVIDIFAKQLLFDFVQERAQLSGLAMDRFGGSVAAFDHRFLPLLHRKGYVAPNIPVHPEHVGSPGGYVMESEPGIYDHVLVLDFKSLYPSIIRTFKIDPFSLVKGLLANPIEPIKNQQETKISDSNNLVPGFNGAVFHKTENILPKLLEDLWQARDKAKKQQNQPLSQAIKILMNSFYGVMGTPGCRFFDFRLPSSVTLRGHHILYQSKDVIESKGYKVIYGDTDSLFVWLKGYHPNIAPESIQEIGRNLAKELNEYWKSFLLETYKINSFLELEFETHFKKFIMPTIRGQEKGSKKRYAGVKVVGKEESLIFKGLETVRNDWTALAKQFQIELYRRIFYQEDYKDLIVSTVKKLYAGASDDLLVYSKRLRRNLDEYTKTSPPHVKAGRYLLEQAKLRKESTVLRRGDYIQYVLTVNGPETTNYIQSKIDYDAYIEKQLKPVADGILHFIDDTFDNVVSNQLTLL